jgi:hypothetical protein
MKCLSHSKKDGERTEQCEGRHVKVHWLCRYFSDPEGPKTERRQLPEVVSQPGRQKYECRQVIHVKSWSDLETGNYSVQLMMLYDPTRRHSFIRNEVAEGQALRYVRVPERSVEISEHHKAKTTKLFILDVKPRSVAKAAGALMVTAYGVDDVELMAEAAPKLDLLRHRFSQRPGELSNTSVAQPAGPINLVIGKDNPAFIPAVIARSAWCGTDLYVIRNDLFPGEMLFGETEKADPKQRRLSLMDERKGSSKKKSLASGSKQIPTPKPKRVRNRSPLDSAH